MIHLTASNRCKKRAPPSNIPEILETQENIESGEDEFEKLMGPFLGSPVDISIFRSFKTHVAAAIWYNR